MLPAYPPEPWRRGSLPGSGGNHVPASPIAAMEPLRVGRAAAPTRARRTLRKRPSRGWRVLTLIV